MRNIILKGLHRIHFVSTAAQYLNVKPCTRSIILNDEKVIFTSCFENNSSVTENYPPFAITVQLSCVWSNIRGPEHCFNTFAAKRNCSQIYRSLPNATLVDT